MDLQYQASNIETQAQQDWERLALYQVSEHSDKPKYYACSMLPYPSGRLHMGHVRNYTINDMLTRYLRMRGFNVLMPMGWDAFGLPAENAAIKNKVSPAAWTYENIDYMKKQMLAMGFAIDWSRELATCDPQYYRWNQWLFLKMLDKGIAYRKTQIVNWDPVDQTVLANEQVIDGRGWRTGALVEKREIPGYYLRISAYAEDLLQVLKDENHALYLHGWPERVRIMQENWIGKSRGLRFAFTHNLRDANNKLIDDGKLYVFTTRPDTIMGVTFCAVAAEHPLAQLAASQNPSLATFVQSYLNEQSGTEAEFAQKEKLGIATGLTVTHPLTGASVPVWIANYVLAGYGDGAVMGVPAHDERDFAFALKYQLPIQQVIAIHGQTFDKQHWQHWYVDKVHGICVNSGVLDGLPFDQAFQAIAQILKEKGLGEVQTRWRLRDWGISRQRYWGTPIPVIHCAEHGAVPVPEKDLPVVLPLDCTPDGSGNPLNHHSTFVNTTCPRCGAPAKRETDTMDTFVDSSWYFMRYCDPKLDSAMVGAGERYWMPMDQYIGGIEHAILHLLYARFWVRVMFDLGLTQTQEPFVKLLTQGMVLNHIYSRRETHGGISYFWPHEVENLYDDKGAISGARLLADGSPIVYEGIGVMSKSKSNGVDPQQLIARYGADTARLYTMFTAPPESTLEWNDHAVEGCARFLKRVWACAAAAPKQQTTTAHKTIKGLRFEIYSLLKQAQFDYERMQYNTVVSACMKMLNAIDAGKHDLDTHVFNECFSILLRVLYPVCPHITYVLWQQLGYERLHGNLVDAPWPEIDENALQCEQIEFVLQINGKTRGKLSFAAEASQQAIIAEVYKNAQVAKFVQDGASITRVIVVPQRLINVVIQ